jgi:hypothetical protein
MSIGLTPTKLTGIAWSFVERPPVSAAGIAALLAYASEHEDAGYLWPGARHHFSEAGEYLCAKEIDWRKEMNEAVAAALATMTAQSLPAAYRGAQREDRWKLPLWPHQF